MPSMVLLTGHSWALTLAATVAKGHTRGKRGHRDGCITTWTVEDNAGTEVSIVRLDKVSSAGQRQSAIRIQGGGVILVLEGVLGNNGQRYGAGTIVCLRDGEAFAPVNSNQREDCWYAVLWFAQPTPP